MKQSRFNVNFNLDRQKDIIYNTLSKKYYIYDMNKRALISNLLNNIEEDAMYDETDVRIIKKLASKGMIIDKDLDEIEKIRFNENKTKFRDDIFNLTIQPTLDCNFRCIYCYEEHKKLKISDDVEEKIINFVKRISKNKKLLKVYWFGGEPTLEIDRIVSLTEKMKDICKENNCIYKSDMITNGYLLTEELINKLKILSVEKFQITVDGSKELHDKQRPLFNGEGTFERIKSNIVKSLELGIKIILRINITEQNYNHIEEILDMIPENKRKDVYLTMANLFQNNTKLNLFHIYKSAINKGYVFYNRANKRFNCNADLLNSITIEPNGKIPFCSPSGEKGMYMGELKKDGSIRLKNEAKYYKFYNISATYNEKCMKCKQLPICMGGCRYSRYKDENVCNGLVPDGLKLEEKIELQYLSDFKHNNIKDCDVI